MYDVKVQQALRNIAKVDAFEDVLNKTTLDSLDKKILKLHYLENKDFLYIADALGYSESGVKKRHLRALKKISVIL